MFHPDVLHQMVLGALECLLWSEIDDDGEPFDATHNLYDITPDSQAEIAEAVIGLAFTIPNDVAAMLDHYASTARGAQWSHGSLFGHDFILSSNGHGAGFWDRGAGDLGRRISDMCVSGYHLYVGDDNRLHVA